MSYQFIKQRLPSVTWAASSNATLSLRDLMTEYRGQIAHCVGLGFNVHGVPTLTAEATRVGQNAIVPSIEFNDGRAVRFRGSFNDLRFFERLESGNKVVDFGGLAGDIAFYYARNLWFGPPDMAGFPGDFALPCAALLAGSVSFTFGAITDYSADTTALTVTIFPVAYIICKPDTVTQPCFYERSRQVLTGADTNLPLPGLLANLSLANSSAYDAFGDADISNVTVETGLGSPVQSVMAHNLTQSYNAEWRNTNIDSMIGDAPDVSQALLTSIQRSLSSQTALASSLNDLQPIMWTPPRCKVTGIPAYVPSSFRLTWTGANGAGTYAHVGRFVAQDAGARGRINAEAAGVLKRNIGAPSFKLLRGGNPGPYGAFLASTSRATK